MNWLLGSRATNDYWQQLAAGLFQAGALGEYRTGFVDVPRSGFARRLREALRRCSPEWERRLKARRITTVPTGLVRSDAWWDLARVMAARTGAGPRVEDWVFDRGERRFDEACAQALEDGRFDGFIGAEYGSLAALKAARRLGKTSVVTFVSAHHSFREKWVDERMAAVAGLMTPARRRLLALGRERDARRDEEARQADWVLTCSLFVSDSLEEAGIPAHKLITIPLGCPDVVVDPQRVRRPGPFRFMFAGGLSLQKGVPYLLDAWKRLRIGKRAELHLYGASYLPETCFADAPASVQFHGVVPRDVLDEAYAQADMLVFPSLCDGFGAVVSEALARGTPVITTPHAGASSLIRPGRNGRLVAPANPDMLAEAMAWAFDHPSEVAAMRTAAAEAARAASWRHFRDSVAEDLVKRVDRS